MQVVLGGGPGSDDPQSEARLCLGDWCLARGVELASAYQLPIKLHTGYLAETGQPARTCQSTGCERGTLRHS